MQITLPWGDNSLDIDVPGTWTILYPKPRETVPPPSADEAAIVAEALARPAGAKALAEHGLADKNVLIIVDDNTRPTPAHRFFHLVLEALQTAGADPDRITLLTALGIHTPMTDDEMAQKIGAGNLSKIQWENHDAFDADRNLYMGTTRRGTPVHLNRRVKEADLIVLIGLIEPHLMAGFGGGMKNILPGVASAHTIGAHHELLTRPPYQANRVGMPPEQNDFRLDLEEIRDMIRAGIFCVNVALSHRGAITACFAGDPVAAHRQGVAYIRRFFGATMKQPVDGVITNAYPMEINFKQSMKCVGNALPAVKPGGAVMGFLKADRGLDDIPAPDGSPLPLPVVKMILRRIGPSRVYGFLNLVKKGMDIEEKFLYYYTMQLIRGYDLFLYVPSLTDGLVKKLFFFKGACDDPARVIAMGVGKLGKNATVAVFPHGGSTFPIIG
ncbi:MAG: nickel-dependent lactate racemase [Thermodesulfobacteriota bacterium]